MISESPPFWWEPADWKAWALWPASALYGLVAGSRMDAVTPAALGVPVLCVGNFTVGGAGKTPTAIAMAKAARAAGRSPGFVSRGHGGILEKPRLVDAAHDAPATVGDEPLLLAAVAPTAVGADRFSGARALVDAGCDFVIMDDGFQSRRIRWDHALLVIDAGHGLGNGHVIPGGPVRAPMAVQVRHSDSLVVVGDGDAAATTIRRAARAAKPIHAARAVPVDPGRFAGKRVFAFCGIAHPRKFHAALELAGAEIVATRDFPDHHMFGDDECRELVDAARNANAWPVTTAKDMVRLAHGAAEARHLAAISDVLAIEMVFEPEDVAAAIIAETIRRFRARGD